MLSFMREQTIEDLTGQKSPGAASGVQVDGAANMRSLGTGESPQGQEYITVAVHDKNVRKTTFLLVFLFAAGLLCILLMIKNSTLRTAAANAVNTEDTEIEMAIVRLTGVRSEMFTGMDEIVKKFYEFSDVQQVNVSELVKNPFKREMFLGDLGRISTTKEGDPDTSAAIIRQQQLMQQAKELQLLSIMQSDRGYCCMIDDKILSVGDSIRGFEINQISDSFVVVESEGVKIILKLSE